MEPSETPPAFVFRHTEISIAAEKVWLDGLLSHAPDARGLVVFLDSGAGRLRDPLTRLLPAVFEGARYASMSVDLLTRHEEMRDPDAHFNVPLMHHRLVAALEWIEHQPQLHRLPLAVVAAGTATAAAIRAASQRPDRILCLVCIAGRPDLAGAGPLSRIQCPTRFIVGADDPAAEHHHRPAFKLLGGPSDWVGLAGRGAALHSSDALRELSAAVLEWLRERLPASIPLPPADDEP
ncbi:MAG: alpha/beta hydrolase [Rhodocyclaceae bacterium]|nr:alpha/beta hydrolase [Zoogloeaceae bacterium]MCP5254084.1 alpha/beta hydrolase [Zoogloeaceae bacterium]MCP5295259.1 alpha/beta hydrolase [Zoogloeaceae bacterium]MCW5613680.1 alpha/beta hydrolase [Rhodocyclaceae bacterium]